MIIQSTGRDLGLIVNDQVDQRLDVELATDAAIRLLKADHLLFNDWLLSVLAFNIGENRLKKAMEETGSRDAWELIRKGYENDKDYLPRVMASILIMRNPHLVD